MKSFYIVVKRNCITGGNYGKGISLKEALKLCKIKKLSDSFVIYQAIVKQEATPEQLENLAKCFNVNDMGGVSMYQKPSKEDVDMVEEFLLGWITNEDFIKK
jgi:hypothetical protein